MGLSGSGRTTLFRALTAGRVDTRRKGLAEVSVGMTEVPDERLQRLAAVVHPKRVVGAQVRFVDIGIGMGTPKAELGPQQLAILRECSALLLLVSAFADGRDPEAELGRLMTELALADLATLGRREQVLDKEARVGTGGAREQLEIVGRLRQQLDSGQGLTQLDESAQQLADGLALLSGKPQVWIVNVAEGDLPSGGAGAQRIVQSGQAGHVEVLVLSAELESQLLDLDPQEAGLYRQSLGLTRSGLEMLTQAAFRSLGLISFFTAGEPEVRAWPVSSGSNAVMAAGTIHSDFERLFIRAEVASIDEVVSYGSMEALRSKGKLRTEGKDYLVNDGDVVFFRVGR